MKKEKEEKQTTFSISEKQKEKLIKDAKEKKNTEFADSIDWNEMDNGDTVIGKILLNDKNEVDFGDEDTPDIRTVVPIVTEDGTKSLWLNKLLQKKLEEEKVKHEDVICILYKGKVKGKKYRYHDFNISVI